MTRVLPALLAVTLLALGAGEAVAKQVVLFSDGRTMTVEAVVREEGLAVLTLEGGGSISVPADRVENWWELADEKQARRQAARSAAWRARAGSYAELIEQAAEKHDLDPALLTAMAEVESAFDAEAVSHKGAQGLLQLMPATAERFGVRDAFDASQNVDGGARYMRWLLERYEGQTELALAGYNAGEAAVDRYQGIPPYRETQNYVNRVLESVDRLATAVPAGR